MITSMLTAGTAVYEFRGLSTDTKPTDTTGIENGSTFFEMDTGKVYFFKITQSGTTKTGVWILPGV